MWSIFFLFKQKTAYEMRISDWSSDVCSSDLDGGRAHLASQRLDPGRDVKRLQAGERCDAARRYPSQKLARCARIGTARMGIADGDGEELEEAQPRPLNGRRDERGQRSAGCRERGELGRAEGGRVGKEGG